jgi:hypothetical protein
LKTKMEMPPTFYRVRYLVHFCMVTET